MKCPGIRRTLDYPMTGIKMLFRNSIFIYIGVAIISLFIFIPVYAQSNESVTENYSNISNMGDSKTFTSDSIGISFNYPSKWEVQEKQNRFENAPDVSVSNGTTNFIVSKTDSTYNKKIKDLGLYEATKSMQRTAEDNGGQIIEQANVSKYRIGGEPTGTLLYAQHELISIAAQIFILEHKGQAYLLGFKDSTKTFDSPETQMIMNKILKSFKFLN